MLKLIHEHGWKQPFTETLHESTKGSKPTKGPTPTFTGAAWTPPEIGKADFQFRRQQSFTVSAKKLEAIGQTGTPIFLAVRLLGSVADGHPCPLSGKPIHESGSR